MKSRRSMWLAAILLVAGCREAARNEVDPAEATEAATPAPADDSAPAGERAAPDSSVASAIPAEFQGTWDRDASSCAGRGSEMRVVVYGNSLRFHESVVDVAPAPQQERSGTVASVTKGRQGDVFVTARFEGEGERRTRDLLLSLEGDGRLTVTQFDAPPMMRVRCP